MRGRGHLYLHYSLQVKHGQAVLAFRAFCKSTFSRPASPLSLPWLPHQPWDCWGYYVHLCAPAAQPAPPALCPLKKSLPKLSSLSWGHYQERLELPDTKVIISLPLGHWAYQEEPPNTKVKPSLSWGHIKKDHNFLTIKWCPPCHWGSTNRD